MSGVATDSPPLVPLRRSRRTVHDIDVSLRLPSDRSDTRDRPFSPHRVLITVSMSSRRGGTNTRHGGRRAGQHAIHVYLYTLAGCRRKMARTTGGTSKRRGALRRSPPPLSVRCAHCAGLAGGTAPPSPLCVWAYDIRPPPRWLGVCDRDLRTSEKVQLAIEEIHHVLAIQDESASDRISELRG